MDTIDTKKERSMLKIASGVFVGLSAFAMAGIVVSGLYSNHKEQIQDFCYEQVVFGGNQERAFWPWACSQYLGVPVWKSAPSAPIKLWDMEIVPCAQRSDCHHG